jgi:small subunit ribosomal protein S16
LAVKVRLTRVGSKKNPIWRVVVADGRSPRDGRTIETIGHYNPQTQPSRIEIDRERLQHWIDRGAQPSNTVKKLIRAENTGHEMPKAEALAPVAAKKAEPEPEAPAAAADAPAADATDSVDAAGEQAPPEGEAPAEAAAEQAEAEQEDSEQPAAEASADAEADADAAEAQPPAEGDDS